jgi:bifunctional UDP-N-acetylglucosamine pyrophosphorylase/glucosamine-1-phosphate N-acetyltransferase
MARLAAVILAAGRGTRMKSDLPKVMHAIAGRPMIAHVLASLVPLEASPIVTVVAPGMSDVAAAVAPHATAIQQQQRGTAHAVQAAREALGEATDDLLIVYGDSPLITTATLQRLLERRRAADRPALVVLGMRPTDGGEYGRLIVGGDGRLEAIVEHREASEEQRRIGLCNSGIMVVDGQRIWDLLAAVGNSNAKGEYYLTDVVEIACRQGLAAAALEGPAQELLGINSRAELAAAESLMQARLRAHAMAQGATLVDPATVWFSHDTRLGRDVIVGPNVVFGRGVAIGDGVEIQAFCHLDGTRVEQGATIGPFARLRPGSVIGAGAHIGNFVETKNTRIAAGAKANHLTYLGDTTVGERANIGAGTITCNYDGFGKYETTIGAGAFIGSNSALCAPVTIGEGAFVAAGSVITRDVAPDALAIARSQQTEKPGWATMFRQLKEKMKKARS